MTTPAKTMADALVVMEYTTTPRFRQIERHTAVAREDGSLIAVTGPAGDAESEAYARRFAASGNLLAACKATLEYWESDPSGFAECAPGCDCIVDQVRAAIAGAEEAV